MRLSVKNLAITTFVAVILIGIISIVNAQEILPKGGDSFETAVEIEPGSYEGTGLVEKGVPEYFYINVKPGQELKLEGTFKAFSDGWGEEELTLYNGDRKKLVEVGESMDKGQQVLFSFSWLPGSEKDLYKYYIKRECTWHKIESLSLDISLTDRYDAGSQTDAGDSFEKPMSITPGEYEAYLSGKEGSDYKDFYKLAVKKGETLTAKVTPPGETAIRVTVYDSSRKKLKDEYAPNPGAIVKASLVAEKSEDVFVAVMCDEYCSENVAKYTLNITTEAGAKVIEGEEEEEEEEDLSGEPIGGLIEKGLGGEEAEKIAKGFFITIMLAWLLPMIIGLIVLVVIIVVIVILVRKKKK